MVSATATAGNAPDTASARMLQRLDAWAQRHAQAAVLARLASLAVRVDASLLRRLRLQLLPQAEPGIEADLWFAGLHAAVGGGSLVFDAAVQQQLRRELCQAPAAPGQPALLHAAWLITSGLHTDWPEALRTEEALTYQALAGGADAAAQIQQMLQPALAAMAQGGEARALEVARWAQRAMPRLPDAARRHPAALALWLGALARLGAGVGPLPAVGAQGLPPALRWLLPAGPSTSAQTVACQPLADGLRLQVLASADQAPAGALLIQLPPTQPLLLALHSHGADGRDQHHTLALDGDTTVPLPADWQWLQLHNLAGQRWRLQRQASAHAAAPPLDWRRTRALVLDGSGQPVGQATFVSPNELVTVVDVLPLRLLEDSRAGRDSSANSQPPALQLQVIGPKGRPQTLRARVLQADLRSPLVLLGLWEWPGKPVLASPFDQPWSDGLPVWCPAGLVPSSQASDTLSGSTGGPWQREAPQGSPRPALDPVSEHLALTVHADFDSLPGIAGAPVFQGSRLLGIADLASTQGPGRSTLAVVPVQAVQRLLQWARQTDAQAPTLLLHHPVDDPDGKAAEPEAQALERLERAAGLARARLLSDGAIDARGRERSDEFASAWSLPGVQAAVRLVTPMAPANGRGPGRMATLALAARRWAQPDFGLVNLGFRHFRETPPPPLPLRAPSLVDIEALEAPALARLLLDALDPAGRQQLQPAAALELLRRRAAELSRAFAPDPQAFEQAWQDLLDGELARAVRQVQSWRRSSRLPGVALVELLAQAALPSFSRLRLLPAEPSGALALNAMPVQLARLWIARVHAGHAPPPCVVMRDQRWDGLLTVRSMRRRVHESLAQAIDSSVQEAEQLMHQLRLRCWVLIATRPLPSAEIVSQLQSALPSCGFIFLAGNESELAAKAQAAGIEPPLQALQEGADMAWLQAYKQLMQWAAPRKPTGPRRSSKKPLAR